MIRRFIINNLIIKKSIMTTILVTISVAVLVSLKTFIYLSDGLYNTFFIGMSTYLGGVVIFNPKQENLTKKNIDFWGFPFINIQSVIYNLNFKLSILYFTSLLVGILGFLVLSNNLLVHYMRAIILNTYFILCAFQWLYIYILKSCLLDEIKSNDSIAISNNETELKQDMSSKKGKLRVGSLRDIQEINMTPKELTERLIEIDYKTMHGLTYESEGDLDQWEYIFANFAESWRVLIDENDLIVGYWHFVALDDDTFAKAKSGKLLECEITAEKVTMMSLPGQYNCYFVSIAILPEIRGGRAFILLVNALFDLLEDLAENEIYVKEWCTNAFTLEGVSLSKSIGLEYMCDHQIDKGKIYHKNFIPLPDIKLLNKYSKLKHYYNQIADWVI